MPVQSDRQQRLIALQNEKDKLEHRTRIIQDIGITVTNRLLPDLEKLMRYVMGQEIYIKELILHDLENAKTYLHFIKTSAEAEKELSADKIKEMKREMESLKR